MRTSYSKLSVIVGLVALGTTACSSSPTSPTGPKFQVAATVEADFDASRAIVNAPEQTGWAKPLPGTTQNGYGRGMIYRSGYIISTGNLGGPQNHGPNNNENNGNDDRDR